MDKEGSKRQYKKRTAWTDVSEQMLLEMWEDKILQLRGSRKNRHVYAEIAAELQKNDFPISATDVQAKIHNLSSRFRKEKALVGPSGGSPSEWPLYGRVDVLLGSYRYYNVSQNTLDSIPAPRAAATEAAAAEQSACESELNESSASTSTIASPLASPSLPAAELTATRPQKRNKFQQVIMKQMTEVKELIQSQVMKMEKTDAEMKQIEVEKKELLQKLVDKQCTVLDSMLEYINSKTF